MAISIKATRKEHSITVWLTGLNPDYIYEDRYLEYFICESGTGDYESNGVMYMISSGITTTPKYTFGGLESSTEYDIKIKIGWLTDRSEVQVYELTKWTDDPEPILQKFSCYGDYNDDDDWLRAVCRFEVDNISEGNTEYTISARQSGTVDFWAKTGDNLYKYSVTEHGDSAKGIIAVRLNSSSDENRIYDFMLTVKAGANIVNFYAYNVEVTYNPIESFEALQGAKQDDGKYQVNFETHLRTSGFYIIQVIVEDTSTGLRNVYDIEDTYDVLNEYALTFDDFLPGNYWAQVWAYLYESEEAYLNSEDAISYGLRTIYFDVEGPPIDYFKWQTNINAKSYVPCTGKELHPVTAVEWRDFISSVQELREYLESHFMYFTGFPKSFTSVSTGMDFTPAIYNEAAAALRSLSYWAGEKFAINDISEETELNASLFLNLQNQLNFLIDEI